LLSRPASPTPEATSPAEVVPSSSTPNPGHDALAPTDTPFPQIFLDTAIPEPPSPAA
jgi:hypothetical protein